MKFLIKKKYFFWILKFFSQIKRKNPDKLMCWTFFSKKYLFFDVITIFSFQATCFSSIIESVNAFFSWTAIHITYLTIVNDSIHIYHNFLCFKELSKKISLTLARLCLKNFKAFFQRYEWKIPTDWMILKRVNML